VALEGLENEARKGQKGLWADPKPVPPWAWRKIKTLGVTRYDPKSAASPINRGAVDVPVQPVRGGGSGPRSYARMRSWLMRAGTSMCMAARVSINRVSLSRSLGLTTITSTVIQCV